MNSKDGLAISDRYPRTAAWIQYNQNPKAPVVNDLKFLDSRHQRLPKASPSPFQHFGLLVRSQSSLSRQPAFICRKLKDLLVSELPPWRAS